MQHLKRKDLQEKTHIEFSQESIKFCLNKAGIKISDIDYVTINTNPYNNILKKILFVLKNPSSIKIAISSLRNSKKKINIGKILSSISDKDPFKGKVKFIDHRQHSFIVIF